MYALMSANEYVTHRYYQHNEVTITAHAMPAPARIAPAPEPTHKRPHKHTGGPRGTFAVLVVAHGLHSEPRRVRLLLLGGRASRSGVVRCGTYDHAAQL